MTTIPRPRLVSRSTDLEAEELSEQITIALRRACWQCELAFSVGIGLAVLDELFEAEVVRRAATSAPRPSEPFKVVSQDGCKSTGS